MNVGGLNGADTTSGLHSFRGRSLIEVVRTGGLRPE
jgi:hypothetical protein